MSRFFDRVELDAIPERFERMVERLGFLGTVHQRGAPSPVHMFSPAQPDARERLREAERRSNGNVDTCRAYDSSECNREPLT